MRERVEMPKQNPAVRRRNFNEVALGYQAEQAVEEAKRCLQCKNQPCVAGCPVSVPIPEFIKLIGEGKFAEAAQKIKEKNALPAICGRVCPQESQCEGVCTLGKKGKPVAIGSLERFAADWERETAKGGRQAATNVITPEPGKKRIKVAVVGSGPAGLTAAADLAKMGYQVTMFESLHATGGVLRYGIPEFRLPKGILEQEVAYVRSLGVEIQTNVIIGQTIDVEELRAEGYEAIFVGTGAGLPYFLGIPGENLNGVYSANEFLTRVNLMKAYLFPEYDTPIQVGKRVAVVGAGNVAMDSARTALRLGAEEVSIVYRRSRDEMPARHEEIENAEEEGVQLCLLTNPIRLLGNDKGLVEGMEVIRMELGEPDASGRRRPVPVAGSETVLPVDTVVVAIGQGPNPLLVKRTPGLVTNKHGNIQANEENGQTSLPYVFAGGDIVTGAATVIKAMGAGKTAAKGIDDYLKGLATA
ncbi:MAG: NADPH-dependent glutamate synthase [Syntrophothermus sp.]